jgi:hypothetical protein
MNRTVQSTDERLNALVTEVAELTGENYVTAMCQALEERRDRLVGRPEPGQSVRVVRLRLDAEIPVESLTRIDESGR